MADRVFLKTGFQCREQIFTLLCIHVFFPLPLGSGILADMLAWPRGREVYHPAVDSGRLTLSKETLVSLQKSVIGA